MIALKKPFLILFLLFSLLSLRALTLEPGTPVFLKPDAKSAIVAVIDEAGRSFPETGVVKRGFSAQHPMAAYHDFHEIRLPDGNTAYATPGLRATQAPDGRLLLRNIGLSPIWRQVLFSGLLLALGLTALQYYKDRKAGKLPEDSTRQAWYFAAGLILLRQCLLLVVVMGADNIICSQADEAGYFQVGADLLQGKFTGPWNYPIGLGLLFYAPAIALTGAQGYYDLAVVLSYITGLIVSPLMLALAFAVLRKLGLGNRKAAIAILLWCVLPLVLHHVPDWNRNLFTAAVGLPSLIRGYRYYVEMITLGYNAMSDTLSTMLLMLTFCLPLYWKRGLRLFAITGIFFALCCMVRINNILFAPVVALLLFYRHREELADWKFFGKALLTGMAAFLAAYAFQFWINAHQYGSPFTFSYISHYTDWQPGTRPNDGFQIATVLKKNNLNYLIGSNFAVIALGACAMAFLKERKMRLIFCFWAIPTIWFFCGYSHTFCDANRFILSVYPALFGAFLAMLYQESRNRRELLILSGVFAVAIFFSMPWRQQYSWMMPWDWQSSERGSLYLLLGNIAAAATAFGSVIYFLYRKSFRSAGAAGCFALLYFAATPWILALALLLLLIRGIWDLGCEIVTFRREYEKTSADPE